MSRDIVHLSMPHISDENKKAVNKNNNNNMAINTRRDDQGKPDGEKEKGGMEGSVRVWTPLWSISISNNKPSSYAHTDEHICPAQMGVQMSSLFSASFAFLSKVLLHYSPQDPMLFAHSERSMERRRPWSYI